MNPYHLYLYAQMSTAELDPPREPQRAPAVRVLEIQARDERAQRRRRIGRRVLRLVGAG